MKRINEKQLSSLELHFLLKELEVLKGSRVEKIYQPEENLLIFDFYKTGGIKATLKIIAGQTLFFIKEKESYNNILNFAMLLRKYLDNYFLDDIAHIKPERIIRLCFRSKDDKKIMYLEFFGGGNIILCNDKDNIIGALKHREFRERTIKPKFKYIHPVMNYNIFNLHKNELIELLKNSKKDRLVTSLAIDLGLGGVYSEEVCLLSSIDKNCSPNNIDKESAEIIYANIKNLIEADIKSEVILQEDNLIDVVPITLKFYEKYLKKSFLDYNGALLFFYAHTVRKETELEKRLNKLKRIIEEQKSAIEELKKEEKDSMEKGEAIYHEYAVIKEIIEEINKATKKYSWKEIKDRLKEHKLIKEINDKERKIVVEIKQ